MSSPHMNTYIDGNDSIASDKSVNNSSSLTSSLSPLSSTSYTQHVLDESTSTTNNCDDLMNKKPRICMRDLSSMKMDMVFGSGTYGEVFKATDLDRGCSVALKRIKMLGIDQKSPGYDQGFPHTSIREIKILKALRHDNIVGLIEMIVSGSFFRNSGDENSSDDNETGGRPYDGDIFMVMEYCDFDLSKLLKSPSINMTTMHILSFMSQLLKGVQHMHSLMILHRDIKPANILITRDNVLKIADLGLARCYFEGQQLTNYKEKKIVTLWYRSPELLLGAREYQGEIDMWSVGCLFGELKNKGRPMLPGQTDPQELELIYQLCGSPTASLKQKYKLLPNYEAYNIKDYPTRLRSVYASFESDSLDLLEKMLELDPIMRITAQQALGDKYFSKSIPAPSELPRFSIDGSQIINEAEAIKVKKDIEREASRIALEKAKAREEEKKKELANRMHAASKKVVDTKYKVIKKTSNKSTVAASIITTTITPSPTVTSSMNNNM